MQVQEKKQVYIENDADEKALNDFLGLQKSYKIDYERVNDDDVLFDAMHEADTNDLKMILMRYRKLKAEAIVRDP